MRSDCAGSCFALCRPALFRRLRARRRLDPAPRRRPRIEHFRPRLSDPRSAVEDLPRPRRRVAVVLEILRQRHPLRMRGAEVRRVIQHAARRREAPGEERRARRIAERELAIRAVEPHRARGELVHVRRQHPLRAIATDLRTPVVCGEKRTLNFSLPARWPRRREKPAASPCGELGEGEGQEGGGGVSLFERQTWGCAKRPVRTEPHARSQCRLGRHLFPPAASPPRPYNM